jgi:TonB-dependent receptor
MSGQQEVHLSMEWVMARSSRWFSRVWVLALGAFFLPIPILAQTGVVTGQVVDAGSDLVLPGAQLSIEGQGLSTTAGRNGRFLLSRVPAGDHVLVAQYIGYGTVRTPLSVPAGGSVDVPVAMITEAIELTGITAVGQRDGQARALQQQQSLMSISNIVAADQIGRFPDQNIGDAMKRIPGINVMVDQGEARFGMIRGTEPRLNSVTLNGERIPSAEGDTREVQLDLIPADMVQSVEVIKALTPDMEADAIGATVNIVTRQDPPGRRISATLGSGYNLLVEEPMGLGSLMYGDRVMDGRLGFTLSGSWFNHRLGSDNIEAEWEQGAGGAPYVGEFDVRRYDVQRVRRSVSGAFDYDLGSGSRLFARGMYNHRDDFENRWRLRYVLDEPNAQGIVEEAEIRRQTKGGGPGRPKNTRLEDQRVLSLNTGGDHLLGARYELGWSVGYARASEDRPDERYIEWRSRNVPIRTDVLNPGKPSFTAVDASDVTPDRFTFRRMEWMNLFTEEDDLNARVDLRIPLGSGVGGENAIKVGSRVRFKSKLRDNDFVRPIPQVDGFENLGQTPFDDVSRIPYLAGDYRSGNFTNPGFLGGLDLNDPNQFRLQDRPDEYAAANYDANETVTSGYAMWERAFSNSISLVAGVRLEHTSIDYIGNEFNEDTDEVRPTSGSDSYTDVLPGVHLRYEPSRGTVIRAAWTNTLSRPNYFDLVPFRIVSFENMELNLGNPDLDPTRSMNVDLMVERYLPGIGILSGGAFYKDVNDFIFTFTDRNAVDPETGEVFTRIRQPRNGANADLWGVELAYQQQLPFLPGVGVYLNYTYTNSSVKGLNVEGREAEDLPLPGTAPHTGNASLSYDLGPLSLRGSYNYAHDFIDPGSIGETAFFDRYYDTQTHVDVNGSYTVTPQFRIFFEANNLTNQPLRYYQGISARMMQEEFYDRRFTVGLKYDL